MSKPRPIFILEWTTRLDTSSRTLFVRREGGREGGREGREGGRREGGREGGREDGCQSGCPRHVER